MPIDIDFTGYPANLDAHADWVTMQGAWVVTAGETYGNQNGLVSLARYIGRTFNSNQAAQTTFGSSTSGAASAHGCAVRLQAGSVSGYFLYAEPGVSSNVYLGVMNSGSDSYPFSGVADGRAGAKLRLEVTGVGSATRLTAKFDATGAGFIDVPGMVNMDPGFYYDGGVPGISAYSDAGILRLTDFHAEGDVPVASTNKHLTLLVVN